MSYMDGQNNQTLGDLDENRVDYLTPEGLTPNGAGGSPIDKANVESPFGGGKPKPEQTNDYAYARQVQKYFGEGKNTALDLAQNETDKSEKSLNLRIAQTYSDMEVTLRGLGFGAKAKDTKPADVAPALSDILGTMARCKDAPGGKGHEYIADEQKYAEARKLFMDSCKKLWPGQRADETSILMARTRLSSKNLLTQDLTLVHSGGDLLEGLGAYKDGKPPSAGEQQKRIDMAMDQIGKGLKNRAWKEVVYGDGNQSISQEDRQLLADAIRQAYIIELYKDSLGPAETTSPTEKQTKEVSSQQTQPEIPKEDETKVEQVKQEIEEQRVAELARTTKREGMGQLCGMTYPLDRKTQGPGYYPGMGFIKGETIDGDPQKYRELFEVVGGSTPQHEIRNPYENKNRQVWTTKEYKATKTEIRHERVKGGLFGLGEKTVTHSEERVKSFRGKGGELRGENGWRQYTYDMLTETPFDTRPGVSVQMNVAVPPELAQKIDREVEMNAMFPDRYFKALFPGAVGKNGETHIKRKPATELAIVDLRKDPTGRKVEAIKQYPTQIEY